MRELLRDAFARFPRREALVSGRVRLTFAELGERVRRIATVLDEEGVSPVDSVGYFISLNPETIYEARLATYEHGAALFAIPGMLPAPAIHALLRAVAPRLVLYDPRVSPNAPERVREVLPGCPVLAIGGRDPDGSGRLPRTPDRESLNIIDPGSLAGLGFTSGTTGMPKGVTATHGAVAASCRMLLKLPGTFSGGEPQAALNAVPLFAAGSGMVVPAIAAGMTTHVPDRWDAACAADTLEKERVRFAFLTPSMLIDLIDLPDLDARDLSSLQTLVYGSASTPTPKLEEAVRRLGPVLLQGYGMSECLPPVTVLLPEEHGTRERPAPRNVLASAGRPVEGVRVMIETEIDAESDVGEILIQSPTITAGYWNDPERTAAAIRDGWFRSGDVGRFDEEGRLHVFDRKADLLFRGGRTLYPRPIEDILSDHPAVKEAHAVQVPGSEAIVGTVSRRSAFRDQPDEDTLARELLARTAERLPKEERPDRIAVFPGDLPRSVQGKVLKREVRDALGARRA